MTLAWIIQCSMDLLQLLHGAVQRGGPVSEEDFRRDRHPREDLGWADRSAAQRAPRTGAQLCSHGPTHPCTHIIVDPVLAGALARVFPSATGCIAFVSLFSVVRVLSLQLFFVSPCCRFSANTFALPGLY